MSDQNNTSFAHAFLPGLILGLIVGAVAGAFVPDMMSGTKIKIDPSHTTGAIHERDGSLPANNIDEETQALIDDAENATIDDAEEAVEELIDDAKNTLPDSP